MIRQSRLIDVVLAMGLWALVPGPTVAQEPRSYETSLEVAEALQGMDDLAAAAQLMLDLDRAQSSILDGVCRESWTDLIESGEELRMISERRARDEPLTADEKDWETTQQERRRTSESEFKGCFAREAARFDVLRKRRITSNEALVEAYDWASSEYSFELDTFTDSGNPTMQRLRLAYPEEPDENTETAAIQRTVDHWRQESETLLADHDKIVAIVMSATGGVDVFRYGAWKPAGDGFEFKVGDRIRTGPRASAFLRFLDRGDDDDPMTIDIGSNTTFALSEFAISLSGDPRRTGMLELLRGFLRTYTKGWQYRSLFSVRGGTTICGIRGTEIDTLYDPELDEITFKLYSGEVDIRTDSGSTLTLRAGQTVTVTRGRVGPSRPLEPTRPPA